MQSKTVDATGWGGQLDPFTERVDLLFNKKNHKKLSLRNSDLESFSEYTEKILQSSNHSQLESSQTSHKTSFTISTNKKSPTKTLVASSQDTPLDCLFQDYDENFPSTEHFEEEYYCSKTTLGIPLKEYHTTAKDINLEALERITKGRGVEGLTEEEFANILISQQNAVSIQYTRKLKLFFV